MVEWLAGNRIRGTSAEKPTLGVSGVGGWKELGRVNASVGEVTGLADKRYLMVLGHHIQGSGNSGLGLQINGDTTAGHYPRRYSGNGATDAEPTTETTVFIDTNGSTVSGKEWFTVSYIANKSDKEKLGIYDTVYNRNGLGSGQHPHRIKGVYKWTNTTNPISSIKFSDFNGTAMNSASEVIVLGWDPADTHTSNFWEELVDTSWSSGSSVETSAFATKKYLWYQGWFKTGGSMSGSYSALQVGSGGTISTSGYTERYSINGAGDATEINKSNMYGLVGQGNDGSGNELTYINGFIINNSANEKLLISDAVGFNPTTGSGTGSEPNRTQGVGKWVTTGSQINKMKILSAAGSGAWVGGQLKVWGSD